MDESIRIFEDPHLELTRLKELGRVEHTAQMACQREQMHKELLEEASRQPDDLPETLEPFGVTPERYQHVREKIEAALAEAKRQGWQRLIQEEQVDPTIDPLRLHDGFSARLDAHAAEMLEQLLEVHRLHQAFHNAGLDIYNALNSGKREEAISIATAFARRDDRESQTSTS